MAEEELLEKYSKHLVTLQNIFDLISPDYDQRFNNISTEK